MRRSAGRICRQRLQARAAQPRGVKGRQGAADLRRVPLEGRLGGVVEIDDSMLGVGEDHAGRGLVERVADARVFCRDGALVLDLAAQLVLHQGERPQHLTGLILPAAVDLLS